MLAAETIEREVFPGLKLNGIVDVSFQGFIKVVDTLGCAYVNVDHHYYNLNVGSSETNYTSIDLQPGYQKLCYENALDYVRYRHHRPGLRARRWRASRTSCATCASRSRRATSSARSTPSQNPSARRSARPSTPRPAS